MAHDKLFAEGDKNPLNWSEDDLWKVVTTIHGMPEDADSEVGYWHEAMQGSALLMAALHILAQELADHTDLSAKPFLVQTIVGLTMERREQIREIVLKALL